MNNDQIKKYIQEYMGYLEGKNSFERIDYFLSSKQRITYHHRRNRLNKLKVSSVIRLDMYKNLNNPDVIPITYKSYGNHNYAFWFFKYLAKEEFNFDNRKKLIKYGEVKTNYTFINSNEKIERVVCPNCGNNIVFKDDTVCCCEYCKTIVNDDVLRLRLGNFNLWFRDKQVRGAEKFIIVGLLISVLSCFILLPIGIGLIIYGISKVNNRDEVKKKNMEKNILTNFNNNDFSIDIVKEDIINKIVQIHYVDSADFLKYFVDCNIDEYISRYNNVVSCNVITSFLNSFSSDDNNYYLGFEVLLNLCLKENDVVEKQERVNVVFMKNKSVNLNYSDDSKVFSCKSCGSNDVDYLNGCRCNHCNNILNGKDNLAYDWILRKYNAEFINYKK